MKRYRICEGYIIQKQRNIIKLFDSEQSNLYTFNSSGSYIYESIAKCISNEILIEKFARKYKIKREKAQVDVEHFLKFLEEHELIEQCA